MLSQKSYKLALLFCWSSSCRVQGEKSHQHQPIAATKTCADMSTIERLGSNGNSVSLRDKRHPVFHICSGGADDAEHDPTKKKRRKRRKRRRVIHTSSDNVSARTMKRNVEVTDESTNALHDNETKKYLTEKKNQDYNPLVKERERKDEVVLSNKRTTASDKGIKSKSSVKVKALQGRSSATTPWVERYLARTKERLLPVPRDFLSDGFNFAHLSEVIQDLYGNDYSAFLRSQSNENQFIQSSSNLSLYKLVHRLILADEAPDDISSMPIPVQKAAETLYLLVHARFALSPRGLDAVRRAIQSGSCDLFGRCPRLNCSGQSLLPCGLSDEYGKGKICRYCCACGEVFHEWSCVVDGCAWGTSFCHLLLLTYGNEIFPHLNTAYNSCGKDSSTRNELISVVPQIFGFRLHANAVIRYPLKHSRK